MCLSALLSLLFDNLNNVILIGFESLHQIEVLRFYLVLLDMVLV